MIPFVERNYNLVELGPHGTRKSYPFSRAQRQATDKLSAAKITSGRAAAVSHFH